MVRLFGWKSWMRSKKKSQESGSKTWIREMDPRNSTATPKESETSGHRCRIGRSVGAESPGDRQRITGVSAANRRWIDGESTVNRRRMAREWRWNDGGMTVEWPGDNGRWTGGKAAGNDTSRRVSLRQSAGVILSIDPGCWWYWRDGYRRHYWFNIIYCHDHDTMRTSIDARWSI